jgi:hypothetical protein
MTSVTCRLPTALLQRDLWDLLAGAVRRADDVKDGRLTIDDSKRVYCGGRGFEDLETSILAVPVFRDSSALPLRGFLQRVGASSCAALDGERWFKGERPVPVRVPGEVVHGPAERLNRITSKHRLHFGPVRSVIVCPARFNQLLSQWRSKGAVLGLALAELLNANRDLEQSAEPVFFTVDKHGGRNRYAPLLQHAQAERLVMAHEEGASRSVYSVVASEPEVRFTFQPRADAEHLCVALASMVSKYIRELLMLDFNEFWAERVPDLKPTAGYPGDAHRFYRQIRPAARRLGIPAASIWRRR